MLPFLLKHWKVISLVVAALAVSAATALFMRAVYSAGKTAGVAQTQAQYMARDAATAKATADRLAEITEEHQALVEKWAAQNREVVDAVNDKINNVDLVIREIPVENVVTVEGDCDVSYDAIELLDQAARARTSSSGGSTE